MDQRAPTAPECQENNPHQTWDTFNYWDKSPRHESPKEKISIRLDADVLRWFRQRPGYTSCINRVLREFMVEHATPNGQAAKQLQRRVWPTPPGFTAEEWRLLLGPMCPKVSVNARFDADVVKWAKAQGRFYTRFMNDTLRRAMVLAQRQKSGLHTPT